MATFTRLWLVMSLLWTVAAATAATRKAAGAARSKPAVKAARKTPAKKATRTSARRRVARRPAKPVVYADSAEGDNVEGEDLVVRRAAFDALGSYKGSVVVVDPNNGRVLTVVNQKLAFQRGFTPCSTIKIVTALAALNEGVIERTTPVRMSRRLTLDLTSAIALSGLSNGYFGRLGQKVGFEAVRHYAQQFGLGEKAGWGIEEEQAGIFPEKPPYGVNLMMAYGTGISQTPLELAAFISAIANGGTLYYLQYPRSADEQEGFEPKVKRTLEVTQWLDDLRIGMRAAVDHGSGRRANFDESYTVLGKTGSCTDFGNAEKLGWFGAYNETGRQFAVVVLLKGGRAINGPTAAGVAGKLFRNLAEQNLLSEPTSVASAVAPAAPAIAAVEEPISTDPE